MRSDARPGLPEKKVKDVSELRELLVEVWAGLQQNVIDDAIDQWHRHLRACVRARGGHFEYLLVGSLFIISN